MSDCYSYNCTCFFIPILFSKGTPSSSSTWIWPLYSVIIGIFFIFIKLISHRLHVMFDGEEIPLKKREGEQSEEPTGEVDSNEHNFPSTSQDGAETIQLQVLSTISPTEHERTSATENNEVPDSAMESTEAIQVIKLSTSSPCNLHNLGAVYMRTANQAD